MAGQFMAIAARNFKIYIRDKGAVFFSLLSMFIVIGLMVFFLGDVTADSVTGLLSALPGRDGDVDRENAKLLILVWTCAGVISINAVTVTLSVFSSMVKDKASGRIFAIETAPVGRMTMTLGYVFAAWAASVAVCTLTLVIMELYCVSSGMEAFTLAAHLKLLGMIMVNSFTYAAFMYVMARLVKSDGAWSGFGTVVGTLVGFLGGIYLPIGQLSEGIGNVMKCTPVLYGTAMFRDVMTADILSKTFNGAPKEMTEGYRIAMGIDLSVGEKRVDVWQELALLLIFGAFFLMIGLIVLKKEKKRDR